jgi:hypothetical protein
MFGPIITPILLIIMFITKDPGYAIAAGIFDLSFVIFSATRPRRLKEVKPVGNADRSSGS